MRRTTGERRPSPGTLMNMTPMIDVTFLLLTFFMLASHFASAEKVKVDLPRPDDNQSVDRRLKDKVIINMLYVEDTTEPRLQLGPVPVASVADLGGRLREVGGLNPSVQVILRADRRLPYGQVREVMGMIASAGLTRLQVVTDLEPGR
ncbi:MAG: ExbD/TolR family protein [Phycisphaerae bacterium]